MALSQRAVDAKMLQHLETFVRTGEERQFFTSADRKAFLAELKDFIPKLRGGLHPAALSAEARKRRAPHQETLARTHELVGILALLLEAWGRATDKGIAVEVETGPLLVGKDEADDEQRLRSWSRAFGHFFTTAALPQALQPEPVKKQLAAHLEARAQMSTSTPMNTLRAAQQELNALREEGLGHWRRMHSLLDGEFGTGEGKYELKAEFGYERRLRGGGANRKKRADDPPPIVGAGDAPGNGTAAQASAAQAPA